MKEVLKGIRNLLRFYRFLGREIYLDVKEFKPSEIFFFNLIINSLDFPNLTSQFNSNILTCPGSGAGCFWPD